MPPCRIETRDAGVSLIELLVAVLVLSIAVVGLFRVFGAGAEAAGSESERLLAGIVARNRAEEIALGLTDLPGRVGMAGRDWIIESATERTSGGFQEIALTVRPADGGAGATLVTYSSGSGP